MSTITETVELEAACAEAELTDEETAVVRGGMEQGVPLNEAIALVLEARSEADAEQLAGGALAGEVTAEQLADLDKAKASHLRKVRTILGPLAEELEECPHCDGMALAPPGEAMPEPRTHEHFRACEVCNALGQVLTGSKVPGNVFRPCPDCGGRGYLEALDATGAPIAPGGLPGGAVVPVLAPTAEELAQGATAIVPAAPRFGRPAWMGDPTLGQ